MVIKNLLSTKSFNRRQLLIFGACFALVGGYIIYRSFAAAPLVASLEAEQMTLPAGGTIVSDTTASSGKAIMLANNGTASGSVNFPSSVNSLTVVARGTQCSGAPTMNVAIDGTGVMSNVAVSATSWTTYSVTPSAALTMGTHSYSITFNNDNTVYKSKHRPACSRDLYADVSNFYGPIPVTPAPTISISATPNNVTAGQSATITWNSTNASSCNGSGAWSGAQPTQGSVSTGAINQSSTYTLTCTGDGGTASASTTVGVTTGFTTNLTNNMTLTPPFVWTFNPGEPSVKGYFWADGVLLGTASPDASGKYSFNLQASTLSVGVHTLGHAWDLADGTHKTPPSGYTVNIASSSTGGTDSGTWSGPWRNTSYSLPASFTKTITTASAFKSLVSASGSLVSGDVVHVVGPMTLDGCAGCNTSILKKLAAPGASIYFDDNVTFAGDTNTSVGYPAVFIDATNVSLYGGVVAGGQANSGVKIGPGLSTDTANVTGIKWWGLKVHDVGASGIYVGGNSINGKWLSVSDVDIDAEAWNIGTNPAIDVHTVKGTGHHALYVGGSDIDPPLGPSVSNSKFSIYTHDTSKSVGDAEVGQAAVNTEFWIHAQNLSFVPPNAIDAWGAARAFTPWTGSVNAYTDNNVIVHDVEAVNLTGPVVVTDSLGSGPVIVEYGRGTNVLTNSGAYSNYGGKAYQPNSHITYQNVLP